MSTNKHSDQTKVTKHIAKLRKKGQRFLTQYRNTVWLYGSSTTKGVRFKGLPTEMEMRKEPAKAQAVTDYYNELKFKAKPWYVLMIVFSKAEGDNLDIDSKLVATEPFTTQGITDYLTPEITTLLEEYPNNIGYGWIATQSKYFDLEGCEDNFIEHLLSEGIEDQDKRQRLVHEYYQELAMKGLINSTKQ